ncbi:SCO family protein [Paenibacillus senegalensis]|uniref:SCO family protein n=1 Tax=Paenibacillus senegalensis TaxID=1465766 RepID=UPI00028A2AAD|nr:SCO family protein [Paenibacillus senegalensis]
MRQFIKQHWFKLNFVVLVMVIIGISIYQINAQSAKQEFKRLGAAPAFQLENRDGNMMSLDDTSGKVRLIYFYFSTCPDVCMPTTALLAEVQEELRKKKALGDKAVMLSVSFDPENDTKERLEEYSSFFNADPDAWFFLRGDSEEQMKELANEYSILVEKDQDGNFVHNNNFILVDSQGEIRHFYSVDLETKADQIANDMVALYNE